MTGIRKPPTLVSMWGNAFPLSAFRFPLFDAGEAG
jgi:hypothetical protein